MLPGAARLWGFGLVRREGSFSVLAFWEGKSVEEGRRAGHVRGA
jgi:hypothetical protein